MQISIIKHFLSIIILTILITLSFSLLHIAAKAYDTYENDLVIMNTYPFDVQISIFGSKFEFEPFEIKTIEASINENLTFDVIRSADNELIKTITTQEVIKSNIISIIVLNDFGNEVCYLTGDVEPFYYSFENQPAIRYRFQKRNFVNKTEYRSYAHPGNSLIDNFPDERRPKKITGFFPIDCNYVEDAQKIQETVNLYQNYEARVQKKIHDLLKADIGTINRDELELNYYLNL